MKRGFTLIELLAVIVILAIIALIATPIVLSIIEETKQGAIERSAENYITAVEQSILRKRLTKQINPNLCHVREDGNLLCDGVEIEVEMTGEMPKPGAELKLESGKVVGVIGLELGGNIIISANDELKVVKETPEECFTYSQYQYSYDLDKNACLEYMDEFFCDNVEESVNFGFASFESLEKNGVISNLKVTSHSSEIIEYVCDNPNVVIPNGITRIGTTGPYGNVANGFKNKGITSLVIPPTVTEIVEGAFENNQLTNVSLPSSITKISNDAFKNNPLESLTITIAHGVNEIGDYAFESIGLTEVILPSTVTKIGYNAFYNNKLTSIKLPANLTHIAGYAFANNKLTSVSIPSKVTVMEFSAFENNKLENISIGSGLTEIDDGAFYGNQLTSVVIPKNITYIMTGPLGGAFGGNPLTSVIIKNSKENVDITYADEISPDDFGMVPSFGWAEGYSDDNIIWQP